MIRKKMLFALTALFLLFAGRAVSQPAISRPGNEHGYSLWWKTKLTNSSKKQEFLNRLNSLPSNLKELLADSPENIANSIVQSQTTIATGICKSELDALFNHIKITELSGSQNVYQCGGSIIFPADYTVIERRTSSANEYGYTSTKIRVTLKVGGSAWFVDGKTGNITLSANNLGSSESNRTRFSIISSNRKARTITTEIDLLVPATKFTLYVSHNDGAFEKNKDSKEYTIKAEDKPVTFTAAPQNNSPRTGGGNTGNTGSGTGGTGGSGSGGSSSGGNSGSGSGDSVSGGSGSAATGERSQISDPDLFFITETLELKRSSESTPTEIILQATVKFDVDCPNPNSFEVIRDHFKITKPNSMEDAYGVKIWRDSRGYDAWQHFALLQIRVPGEFEIKLLGANEQVKAKKTFVVNPTAFLETPTGKMKFEKSKLSFENTSKKPERNTPLYKPESSIKQSGKVPRNPVIGSLTAVPKSILPSTSKYVPNQSKEKGMVTKPKSSYFDYTAENVKLIFAYGDEGKVSVNSVQTDTATGKVDIFFKVKEPCFFGVYLMNDSGEITCAGDYKVTETDIRNAR